MPKFRVGGTRKHTTKSGTCTKGSRLRLTSRAYADADPGLVCPTAAAAAAATAALLPLLLPPPRLVLLLIVFSFEEITQAARTRRCSFVLVQHNPYTAQHDASQI